MCYENRTNPLASDMLTILSGTLDAALGARVSPVPPAHRRASATGVWRSPARAEPSHPAKKERKRRATSRGAIVGRPSSAREPGEINA